MTNTLVALDQLTGKEKWRFNDTTRPRKGMTATASPSGNKVFISTTIDHDGMPCGARLFCLDDKAGKVLWHHTGSVGTTDTVICGWELGAWG